ncbi:MAG: fasciclin domain-containing protein [Flavobacteriaceae bacterium]
MRNFKYLYYPILLLILNIAVVSCVDDDDMEPDVIQPMNLVELASSDDDLTSLVAALVAADGDLPAALSGSNNYTVLAPSNEAFSTFLNQNGFSSLSEVPTDVLSQILLNHVISGRVASTDLTGAGSGYTNTLATGAGDMPMSLYFDTSNGVMFNGISTVTAADLNATNGIVHKVDAVIGLPTIVDHAVANPNFSSLVGALTTDGNTTFTDLLSTAGDFTVFAPLNDAFASFTNPMANDLNAILANHVIVGASVFSSDLTTGYVKTAAMMPMSNNYIDMYINADNASLNGSSMVVLADVVASNGVIHAVDQVIDLPTVVTMALADDTFSTLVAALTREDLQTDFVSILNGMDMELYPFTVFAPTNDAFGALLTELELSGLGDIDEPTLSATLMNHVVSGANVLSTDLSNQMIVNTLDGMQTIDLTDGAKIIDQNGRMANIVVVDVQTANGVIHVIDKVILPNLN